MPTKLLTAAYEMDTHELHPRLFAKAKSSLSVELDFKSV